MFVPGVDAARTEGVLIVPGGSTVELESAAAVLWGAVLLVPVSVVDWATVVVGVVLDMELVVLVEAVALEVCVVVVGVDGDSDSPTLPDGKVQSSKSEV